MNNPYVDYEFVNGEVFQFKSRDELFKQRDMMIKAFKKQGLNFTSKYDEKRFLLVVYTDGSNYKKLGCKTMASRNLTKHCKAYVEYLIERDINFENFSTIEVAQKARERIVKLLKEQGLESEYRVKAEQLGGSGVVRAYKVTEDVLLQDFETLVEPLKVYGNTVVSSGLVATLSVPKCEEILSRLTEEEIKIRQSVWFKDTTYIAESPKIWQ